MEKIKIALILGTTRVGRKSEGPAKYIFEKLKDRSNIEAEFIDPRDWNLSLNNDGARDLPQMLEVVNRNDGFLIVSPEYNHSYPATLKFIFDQVKPANYLHKAVAICGVSDGTVGGARMIEHATSLFHDLGLHQTKTDLLVKEVKTPFEPDAKFDEILAKFLDELLWLAKSLKWGRENL
jgi:NAD(P)H-dependent FMN reductase